MIDEDMSERLIIETGTQMETDRLAKPIVMKCIDFRTNKPTKDWLKETQALEDGSYFLYASAGASGNPEGFLDTLRRSHHPQALVVDHQDCGYYKKNGGDSPLKHKHNLELLGNALEEQNPEIEYIYHFLPLNDQRHTCSTTAIILGEPEIVRAAREKLESLELSEDHDEIARPYSLSIDDQTLWNDLEISLALHHPTKILLFEKDEHNAKMLIEKIKKIAKNVQVESLMFSKTA